MVDPVNHPAHYEKGDVECIDAIRASMTEEAFNGYLKGNVLKYIWRYESKGKPTEDLRKAQWYLNKLIECTSKPETHSPLEFTIDVDKALREKCAKLHFTNQHDSEEADGDI